MKKPRAVENALPGPEQKALAVQKKTRRTKSAPSGAIEYGSEHPQPQPGEQSVLDERVPGLVFDSLTSIEAAILSATEGVPYRAVRQAVAIGEQEKYELTTAIQAVAAKHPAFFSEHKNAVELISALMAINAARMDHFLSLTDQSDRSSAPGEPGASGEHVCSAREALAIALIVFAPLGVLALVLLIKHLRRN